MSIGDTAMVIVVMVIVVGGMFLLPMIMVSGNADSVTAQAIQAETLDFVNKAIAKGGFSSQELDDFVSTVNSHGMHVKVDMVAYVADANPTKKDPTSLSNRSFFEEHWTQIEEKLNSNGTYSMEKDSTLEVTVTKDSKTLTEILTGKSSPAIATASGLCMVDGN